MATRTARRPGKTPEERAAEVEALAEQLNDAVAELASFAAWVAMLRVWRSCHSPTNCLMWWMRGHRRNAATPSPTATTDCWPSATAVAAA